MAPIWFITKEMPTMPKPQSGFKGFTYLKKEHACLFAQDPGIELFTYASAALNSCTKEDEQTFQVSPFFSGDSVILDGLDSFKSKVPRYPVHGVGNSFPRVHSYNGVDAMFQPASV
jgi:hypothetical protein